MPLYTSIGGARKEITSLYTGVDGVAREISQMDAASEGTVKTIFNKSKRIKYIGIDGSSTIYLSSNGSLWVTKTLPYKIDNAVYYSYDGRDYWILNGTRAESFVNEMGNTITTYYHNTYYNTSEDADTDFSPFFSLYSSYSYEPRQKVKDMKAVNGTGFVLYIENTEDASTNTVHAYFYATPFGEAITHRRSSSAAKTGISPAGAVLDGSFYGVLNDASRTSSYFARVFNLSALESSIGAPSYMDVTPSKIVNLAAGEKESTLIGSSSKTSTYRYFRSFSRSEQNFVFGDVYTEDSSKYFGGIKITSSTSFTPFYYPGTDYIIYLVNSNGIFYKVNDGSYYNSLDLNSAAVQLTGLPFAVTAMAENSSEVLAVGADGSMAKTAAPLSPDSSWEVINSGISASFTKLVTIS